MKKVAILFSCLFFCSGVLANASAISPIKSGFSTNHTSVFGNWRGYGVTNLFPQHFGACHYLYDVSFMNHGSMTVSRTLDPFWKKQDPRLCTGEHYTGQYTEKRFSVHANIFSMFHPTIEVKMYKMNAGSYGRELIGSGYADTFNKGVKTRTHYFINLFKL